MADPIPLGYLPINVAFERYVEGFGTNWDDDSAFLRDALSGREFETITRFPGDPEPKVVPPTSWRPYDESGDTGVFFSERVFSSPEIVVTAEGEWASLRGRTVFVEETAFDIWLGGLIAKFDPLDEPIWTMPMAVAWIVDGTKGAVRAQWPKYLSQTGRHSAPGLWKSGYVNGAQEIMNMWKRGVALPIVTRRDGQRSRLSQDEAASIALTLDDNAYPRFELAHPSGDATRFTMQLLFTDAALHASEIYPHGAAWQSGPQPTHVELDRSAEWTPFVTAALWAANGGRDGDLDGNGLQTGAGEVLDRAAAGTISLQGLLNLPGDDNHGYADIIPASRCRRAVFAWIEEDRKTLPRVTVQLESASDQDNSDYRVDFFLPDARNPRWRNIEVLTSQLVKTFDEDGWITPFEAPGGPGRTSSSEIIAEKMRRRHAVGEMITDNRTDEFAWLARWVSDPNGVPQRMGWPKASERSMERPPVSVEYARLKQIPHK
ncbi:MAG: hypothetical protein ABIQ30_15895 [Devosia sp.]